MPDETAPLLHLLAEVLDSSARHAETRFSVVAVLIDDVEKHRSLLDSVLYHHCGTTIMTADAAVSGITAAPSTQLQELVQSIKGAAGNALEIVQLGVGEVAVRFLDSPDEPTNPGTRNFLGALTAVLSISKGKPTVTSLSYDTSNMDVIQARQLWALLEQLQDCDVADSGTLVIFVGARRVDYEYQWGPGGLLRHVFLAGEWRQRRPSETTSACTRRLAEGDGLLVLFLGAGTSRSSGLPLGDDLRNRAIERYVQDTSGTTIRDQMRAFHRMLEGDERLLDSERSLTSDQFISALTLERVLREETYRLGEGRVPPTLDDFHKLQAARLQHPGAAVQALRQLLICRSGS